MFRNDQRVLLKIILKIHLLLPSALLASLTEGLGSWSQSPFQRFCVSCPLRCFSHICLFVTPWTAALQAPLPTGVGGRALLKGIFPTQWSQPRLLHCRWILYCWATGEAWGLRCSESTLRTQTTQQSCHRGVSLLFARASFCLSWQLLWAHSGYYHPQNFPGFAILNSDLILPEHAFQSFQETRWMTCLPCASCGVDGNTHMWGD